MDQAFVPTGMAGLAPALLQAAVTVLLAALCLYLFRRYGKPYFAWWAVAWVIFALRIAAIITFLMTGSRSWLYWHQVATGWTALALLWAALVFSHQLVWRWRNLPFVLFPVAWSFVAVYLLDNFFLAAGPAVLFLSLATFWTGWVFLKHHRSVGGTGVAILAWALILWGVNHLNYPFLRARGVLNPWSYYLDILFELSIGAGILLAVQDDLRRGLFALTRLSGDLQKRGDADEVLERLLARPLTLPAVRGSAMFLGADNGGRFVRGAGACESWTGAAPSGPVARAITEALLRRQPQVISSYTEPEAPHPFTAVLPVLQGSKTVGALVIVSDARDPFTALDEGFLTTVGQQVGVALENAELYKNLQQRNAELARLSALMVAQHEEERRRLSRELHDETAQVLSAMRMELAVIRNKATPEVARSLGHVVELTDTGIQSIRNVVRDLRPTLLDDLGLIPALRSLISEFKERSGIVVDVDMTEPVSALTNDAELAIFRALQEALSNISRHAEATSVRVVLSADDAGVLLIVRDNGRGLGSGGDDRGRREHMGITGMRERIGALGGRVTVSTRTTGGTEVEVSLPSDRGGIDD